MKVKERKIVTVTLNDALDKQLEALTRAYGPGRVKRASVAGQALAIGIEALSNFHSVPLTGDWNHAFEPGAKLPWKKVRG